MRKILAVVVAALALAFPAEASAKRVRVHRGWHAQARALKAAAAPIQRVAVLQESSESALIEAGRRWGVLSLRTGQQHPALQAAAEQHAQYQANVGVQGHQGFDQRFRQLSWVGGNLREVANESWPGQDEQAAANEMYNSWRQSSGHWSAVNGRCRWYGYSMAYRPQNRTFYACGLFAD